MLVNSPISKVAVVDAQQKAVPFQVLPSDTAGVYDVFVKVDVPPMGARGSPWFMPRPSSVIRCRPLVRVVCDSRRDA
jgi:hypothetical protein